MNYLLVQFTAKLKLKFQYFITLCTQDATAEVDDPTVAYSGDEPVPEAIPIPAQDPAEDSVGPSNISGYDKVVALADFLVSLKDSSGALTHQQTSTIIKLWNELSEYDRKPITFPARHQPQLVDGRFKASKKSTVVPGLEAPGGVSSDRTVDQQPGLTVTGMWRLYISSSAKSTHHQ